MAAMAGIGVGVSSTGIPYAGFSVCLISFVARALIAVKQAARIFVI
jgi:hypothetical protein